MLRVLLGSQSPVRARPLLSLLLLLLLRQPGLLSAQRLHQIQTPGGRLPAAVAELGHPLLVCNAVAHACGACRPGWQSPVTAHAYQRWDACHSLADTAMPQLRSAAPARREGALRVTVHAAESQSATAQPDAHCKAAARSWGACISATRCPHHRVVTSAESKRMLVAHTHQTDLGPSQPDDHCNAVACACGSCWMAFMSTPLTFIGISCAAFWPTHGTGRELGDMCSPRACQTLLGENTVLGRHELPRTSEVFAVIKGLHACPVVSPSSAIDVESVTAS